MWVTSSLTTALTPTAVALGNFDGVHRGHQQVIKPVLQSSATETQLISIPPRTGSQIELQESPLDPIDPRREGLLNAESTGCPYPTVVTFNPHPQEFFSGQPRALLTPPDEKAIHLRSLGVEQLVLLPFDRELANLSPQQFVEEILVRQLQSTRISVGQDFRFGYKRAGTAADLQAIAATYGIQVNIVPLQICEGERISSSAIRQALSEGNIQQANRLLDRCYTLTGIVVQGQQLGRTIGFPTANLNLPPEKFLPRQGVYAVQVFIEAALSSREAGEQRNRGELLLTSHQCPMPNAQCPIPGVMNIGYRPTVNGTSPTVEVHLLDWSGNLYGQTLTVSLKQFLRPEQKFAHLDELKAQIQADCATAKSVLSV